MKDLFLKREGFMYMMTAYAVVHTYKKKKRENKSKYASCIKTFFPY